MKNKCSIIQDLLMLYIDDLTSEESNEFILEHLDNCNECTDFLESLKVGESELSKLDDSIKPSIELQEKLINKIKKSILNTKMIFASIGLIVGFIFSSGEHTFKAVLILPIIGAIFYLVFKKFYIAPIIVFLLQFIVINVQGIFYMIGSNDKGVIFRDSLQGSIMIAAIYGGLTLLGSLVGLIIKKIIEK